MNTFNSGDQNKTDENMLEKSEVTMKNNEYLGGHYVDAKTGHYYKSGEISHESIQLLIKRLEGNVSEFGKEVYDVIRYLYVEFLKEVKEDEKVAVEQGAKTTYSIEYISSDSHGWTTYGLYDNWKDVIEVVNFVSMKKEPCAYRVRQHVYTTIRYIDTPV